jgi:hypothetical protein
MKRICPSPEWPESWRTSYKYDLLEIYNEKSSLGYAYAYERRFNTTLGLIVSVAIWLLHYRYCRRSR